jgi:hypothetical protein
MLQWQGALGKQHGKQVSHSKFQGYHSDECEIWICIYSILKFRLSTIYQTDVNTVSVTYTS